ncbi:MAG: PAS domain S-box protein [Epsilonproteobacteria bacterium]|nr:PAS domain S-box protein [Campylobacterota bacterium]
MENSNYQKAFEESAQGILVVEDTERIIYSNSVVSNMLGYQSFELLTLTFNQLFETKNAYDTFITTLKEQLVTQESIDFKYEFKTKYSEVIWVEVSSDYQPISSIFVITIVDIFKRLESKQKLQFLIEGSNDGIWEWDLISNEVYFSARWKEMLGFEESELKNEFYTWERRLNLEDKETILQEIQNCIDGQADHFVNVHRLRHKEGHWVWIYVRAKTFFDANGKAVYMSGFHTDISDLKNAQKDTEQQYLVLRSLFDATPDLISYKDYEVEGGIYISCNSAFEKFIGLKESELIGKNDIDLFGKERGEYNREQDREVLRQRTSRIIEEWVTYPNEKRVLLHTMKTPVYDDQGKLLGLFGISRDMTEQHMGQVKEKEHHKQLLFQSRLAQMGEMISMIVHQWRQPLNALSIVVNNLYLDHVMQELSDEKLQKSIDQSQKIIKSMTHTIDDFRNFYQQHQPTKMLNINDVIEKALDITENTLISSNIRLKRTYGCRDEIEVHESEMMQVFLNILKNAQDNFKEKKVRQALLIINTTETKEGIEIEICDNGGGIKEEHLEKVFEPYFTTKSDANGTGLGLYMSKMIIEDHHHGKIYAKNSDVGVCFVITLPKVLT